MPRQRHSRLRFADFLTPGEACHFAERTLRPPEQIPLHSHDFIELFWISQGSGSEQTNATAGQLSVGDFVFVSADHVHGFVPDKLGLTICNLAFAKSHWTALCARYGDALTDRFNAIEPRRRFRVPQILGLLDQAADELRRGLRSKLVLDRFLLWIDATLSAQGKMGAPNWLTDAIRTITENTDADLTGGPLALVATCGRSAEHVARSCRKYFHRTPTDIIDEARVRRAARLLATTKRSVLDICFDSGFNNVGHFHARFRHWFGQTPRQYRLRSHATVRIESR